MKRFACAVTLAVGCALTASAALAGPNLGQPVFGERTRQVFEQREPAPYALTGREEEACWQLEPRWVSGGSRGQRLQLVRCGVDVPLP